MKTNTNFFDVPYIEEDREFARTQLNEVEAEVPAAIEELRVWAKQRSDQHLTFQCPLHDEFLLMFLRRAKFSQSEAQVLLENHVRVRCTKPTIQAYQQQATFEEKFEQGLALALGCVLPGLARDGSRVLLYRPKLGDVRLDYVDGLRMCTLSVDLLLHDPAVQLHGITLLGNYQGLGLRDYAKQGVKMVKIATEIMSKHGAHKMAALHAVHTAPIVRGIQQFLKTIMPQSLFAVCKDHGNKVYKLQQIVAPENLPDDLGGSAGSYQELCSLWAAYVKNNLHRLDWLDQFRYQQHK